MQFISSIRSLAKACGTVSSDEIHLRRQPLSLYQALVIELNTSCHILDEVLLPYLKYLSGPTANVDIFQPLWILGLQKEELKPLLSDADVMAKIDQFSKMCYPYISKIIHERI